MTKGWTGESSRHAMARMGIKTATLKSGTVIAGNKKQVNALLKLTKKVNRHIATKKERKKDPYLSSDSYVYEKKVVKPKIKTQMWNVYLNGKKIDSVFYDADLDADYVKDGLINHDNYNSRINVRRGKMYGG